MRSESHGVGIILNGKPKASLLDWITVNSRFCAVKFQESLGVQKYSSVERNLFVIWAYVPTDFNADTLKDGFCDELAALLRRNKSSNIVVLYARVGASDSCLDGLNALPAQRADNRIDNHFLLSRTSYRQNWMAVG